jgi:hypothetical protein
LVVRDRLGEKASSQVNCMARTEIQQAGAGGGHGAARYAPASGLVDVHPDDLPIGSTRDRARLALPRSESLPTVVVWSLLASARSSRLGHGRADRPAGAPGAGRVPGHSPSWVRRGVRRRRLDLAQRRAGLRAHGRRARDRRARGPRRRARAGPSLRPARPALAAVRRAERQSSVASTSPRSAPTAARSGSRRGSGA